MASTANNPTASSPASRNPLLAKAWNYIVRESTFFRLHLFAFTFVPLISSAIFFGCNGRYRIGYLDSLFLCYSAMTVCGLSTVNLSTLTPWQQVILYLLMMIGDLTVVSWIMVLVRKDYFRTKCEYIVARRPAVHRSRTAFIQSISSPMQVFKQRQEVPEGEKKPDAAEVAVPDFAITHPTPHGTMPTDTALDSDNSPFGQLRVVTNGGDRQQENNEFSDARTFSSSPRGIPMVLSPTTMSPMDFGMSTALPQRDRRNTVASRHPGVPFPKRTLTILDHPPGSPLSPKSVKFQNFGGFPGPLEIINKVTKAAAPGVHHQLSRKMTLPQTQTLDEKQTPWLNFQGLVVGRNSDFHTETLSDEELEDIGGAEYKALRVLSYLVPLYFIGTQLFAFLLFAPALSVGNQYDSVFEAQYRLVNKPWFSVFQVMGAYTGGGLSLVDLGMVPFQKAYLMIFGMMFVILAGNHALPIFLRLMIWIGFKVTKPSSDMNQAFSFLFDHPRRCFIYLFPSHQTWFLVICLLGFSALEWGAFEVLSLGLEAFESLPKGTRAICGLFQGLAARASGFSIVSIASFAPALQFMYVVMMYIAVYPVAMSIRATNVYEERSLGVFETSEISENDEPTDLNTLEPRERVGRYLSWHLRRQMSIDLWWLVWGVFFVAIIERDNILDEDKKWFDMFRILFELVSAFGGIGLSLGLPSNNFSFVGAMRPLSKLVVIVIMVRGRHRGLPVAVDRAVLLPSELVLHPEADKEKDKAQIPDLPQSNGVV